MTLRHGVKAVAAGGFLKRLDAADGKRRFAHRLVDDPHAAPLHGLHIAVGYQLRQCASNCVAGAGVFLQSSVFSLGKQGLVRVVLRFDAFFDTAVNSFIFCFWHGCLPRNLFKRLFQYTVIAPEFQGILLSEMPKIFKHEHDFL